MSHQYNRVMNYSNQKNKKIIMKNMRVMNDPAFKSNKTLKEYINKKLESCKEPEFYTQPKSHSILKFNENANKKMKSNRNNKKSKNYDFSENSFYSKTQIYNLSKNNNVSLNHLRKKYEKAKEFNKIKYNNNFFVFRCNDNSTNNNNIINNQKFKKKKNELELEEIKIKKYFDIILTPNNNKESDKNKTTPISPSNKTKGIYINKKMILNKSYKSYSKDYGTIYKKEKEKKIYSPENDNKKRLRKEIYNIINHKPLNKTYFKVYSKKNRNELKSYNQNINYGCSDYFQSENNENKDNIKDLILKDESLNESECPEPMPYVKKYSDIIDKENISNNIINNINKNINDLNEPKEEKIIPLPVSKLHYKYKIYDNNKGKYIYKNQNKFDKIY